MKRVFVILTVILFAALIFFSVFGETLYDAITPQVETVRYTEGYPLPNTVLTSDGCVYVMLSEQGFSRTLYSVTKREISYREVDGLIYVSLGLRSGDRIVFEFDNVALNGAKRVRVK
ncbi:hypothetical protein FACS1894202_13230 [Clostridia bacterium]|nr:hypothetical protein FACS1894202_13230 [Clostridia bacterium]